MKQAESPLSTCVMYANQSGILLTVLFRRRERIAWASLLGLTLLVGVAGQIRVWASDRGFWNDELSICVNLAELRFVDLFGALRYMQVAPPLWLVAEKAMTKVFGEGERALRFPSLVGAVAVLAVTALVAYWAIGRWAAIVAVLLAASCAQLLYYAGELKQYSVEAAAAIVILAATGWFGERARHLPTWRQAALFGGVCAVAGSFSYSALVVLAGAVGGLVLVLVVERRWLATGMTVVAAAPGLVLTAGQAFLRMRLPMLPNQLEFFPTGFAPAHAGPAALLGWLPTMWQAIVAEPLGWQRPGLVLGLVLAGLAALFVRGRAVWAAAILGVFVTAVGAAAVRGLPLQGRVALYLVAPIAIAVAAAIDGAARLGTSRTAGPRGVVRLAGGACVLLVISGGAVAVATPGVRAAISEVTAPRYRDDGRDMLREVAAHVRAGDVVLAYSYSARLVEWYAPMLRLPVRGLVKLGPGRVCRPTTVDHALLGAHRVWYVWGRRLSLDPADYADLVLASLQLRGTVMAQSTKWRNSGWALVDLTAGPDPRPRPTNPRAKYACVTITAPRSRV